ncbi:Glucans biosynthesis protein C [Novipirellula artificiosorum]|uniref:Glucans biosynthesis protein C n=2 Tax=Novipirellula artificiosorum TaxID=2528016 RepID=A0A5C6D4K7_9BACT|nr:Glucans biosynthesis protein C [Novipirellula artificiosorum]
MRTDSNEIRFHSLDALRAYAMLLGIFFHAAWFFVPHYYGTTRTDVSANNGFHFFFYWTHLFRMQIFFLIAGFFARLVFKKRGRVGFTLHRLQRIALPFAAGWIVMYPLFTFLYLWGGIESGRILNREPFWSLWAQHVREWELNWFVLTHLWFLYYLLLLYAMVLALEALLAGVVDRHGKIRDWLNRQFQNVIQSRWNMAMLAIPLWVTLWWNDNLFGITTPSASLVPMWSVLAAYSLFFLVGWLLNASPELLRVFDSRWASKLALGTLLSIPLFLYFNDKITHGQANSLYPMMWPDELQDYSSFRDQLLSAEELPSSDVHARIWGSLSPEYQRFLKEHDTTTLDEHAGLVSYLNRHVILEADLSNSTVKHEGDTPDSEVDDQGMANRAILESAFPSGVITQNFFGRPESKRERFLFLGAYALSTWLLIFGFVGLSNRLFANPSPTVRYVADSSYWLYIIHLPILFQINILVADEPWHWLPKFVLYNVVAFAIMLPSYHWLVRSTWIGKILNGRRYP